MAAMPRCNGKVKILRLEAGLSQNKLARLAELDRSTISSAERGVEISELSFSKLSSALSKALERTVEIAASNQSTEMQKETE